jgi:hypothetical protein
MINDNPQWITMHFDRLNDELLEDMFRKRVVEPQKRSKKTNSDIQISNTNNDEIKEDSKD